MRQKLEFRLPVLYVSLISFLIMSFVFFLPPTIASSNKIEDLLKKHIMENYPWADVEINNIVLNSTLTEEMPAKINIIKGPPGKTVFTVEFKNGKKVEANAYIRVFEQVVMSRRALPKGTILQEKDIYVTLMDVARLPAGFIENPDEVIGKQLTRSVVANKPILDSMVSNSLLVKKGQRVTILADSERFSISVVGQLYESSYIGSIVRVINLSSKRIITGRLIDENTVKVEF